MNYRDIKSNYIRERIKGTSFLFRGFIDELVEVEECILNPPTQWAQAIRYHYVREKYSKEWRAISKELKLGENEELKKREPEEEEIYDRSEIKKEEEENRKEWLDMGGVE